MRRGVDMLKEFGLCAGAGFAAHHISPVINKRWPAYGWQLFGKYGIGTLLVLGAQRYLLHRAHVPKCEADRATVLGLCGAVSVGLGVLLGHFLFPDDIGGYK
jgi:hypothetical protein